MSDRIWWIKQYLKQMRTRLFSSKINRSKEFVVEQYSQTGTRDLELTFTDREGKCMVDGQVKVVPKRIARDFTIDQIANEIQNCNAKRVLEVGAGTSVNLYLLSSRFPDIHFEGIDITPGRVEVGKKWFKENKNFEPNTQVGDVTNLSFPDDAFDLIYSVHCFEQIDQYAVAGITEVCRVAKNKVVFLEPDFKHSNPTQRLFLKNHNYLLNFDKQIESVAPGKLTHTPLNTYNNILNRTGKFVVDLQ